jgi:hypothetical protein
MTHEFKKIALGALGLAVLTTGLASSAFAQAARPANAISANPQALTAHSTGLIIMPRPGGPRPRSGNYGSTPPANVIPCGPTNGRPYHWEPGNDGVWRCLFDD